MYHSRTSTSLPVVRDSSYFLENPSPVFMASGFLNRKNRSIYSRSGDGGYRCHGNLTTRRSEKKAIKILDFDIDFTVQDRKNYWVLLNPYGSAIKKTVDFRVILTVGP